MWKRSFTHIVKSADQTKNSDTALASDSELKVTLDSAATYRVRMIVFYYAHSSPDMKFALNFTGTWANVFNKYTYTVAAAAAGTDNETTEITSSLLGSTSATSTSSGYGYVEIELFGTTSDDGVLSFQWAQNTSDANDVTVLKGSYIEYDRL